ncbi:MAG: CinA family protein [Treponema sp.]|jgi:PncC family amidohydrolase|nr:CinA family protein [Treponema sp.]
MQDSEIELINQAEKNAQTLIEKLKLKSLTLALSESCTAGFVSAIIAGIPGASAVLWGSYVCYKPEAKVSMLGLDSAELLANRLVSGETASSMAASTLQKSGANLAAAVTGLAGPDGDGSNVPVGTVWIAVASGKKIEAKEYHFNGSRNEVRLKAAIAVLELIFKALT